MERAPNSETEPNQEKIPLDEAKKYTSYLEKMLDLLAKKNEKGEVNKGLVETYIKGTREDLEDLKNSLDRIGK